MVLLARSAPEGEADEIGTKADIAARRFAVLRSENRDVASGINPADTEFGYMKKFEIAIVASSSLNPLAIKRLVQQ